jgi:hypothetical protein
VPLKFEELAPVAWDGEDGQFSVAVLEPLTWMGTVDLFRVFRHGHSEIMIDSHLDTFQDAYAGERKIGTLKAVG